MSESTPEGSETPAARQPILRLALPGIPAICGYCGEASETWPLTVYGGQVNATCPACFSVVAPVVAVAT